MQTPYTILKNEEGSVIAIVILIMAIVTLMVVTAVKDTSTELQIARNDSVYKMNFFQAEGAVRQAIQMMHNETDPQNKLRPSAAAYSCINDVSFDPESQPWQTSGTDANAAVAALPGNTASFSAVFKGYAPGSGIDMTESTNLYEYNIYGKSTIDNGDCTIKVGYNIRY